MPAASALYMVGQCRALDRDERGVSPRHKDGVRVRQSLRLVETYGPPRNGFPCPTHFTTFQASFWTIMPDKTDRPLMRSRSSNIHVDQRRSTLWQHRLDVISPSVGHAPAALELEHAESSHSVREKRIDNQYFHIQRIVAIHRLTCFLLTL